MEDACQARERVAKAWIRSEVEDLGAYLPKATWNAFKPRLEPFVTCQMTRGGAWILELNHFIFERTDSGRGGDFDVAIVPTFVRTDGTVLTKDHAIELRWHEDPQDPEAFKDFTIGIHLQDYNADGVPELGLQIQRLAHELFAESFTILGDMEAGLTEPDDSEPGALQYVDVPDFLAELTIDGFVDADGDGRTDIVSFGHYPAMKCFEMQAIALGAPAILYHATEQGIANDDAVARKFVTDQCKATPSTLLEGAIEDEWDQAARRNVACLRMQGTPARALEVRLQNEWRDVTEDALERSCGTTLQQLVDLAKREPVITLRRPP
ncbi:MAG: hypothetical protein K0V04_40610 [Deltaproteobacteria bacterium]|nr:hypothetical protein [Deltaproteobacteria bacterium]